jgi:mRNA interferase MazF
VPFQWRIFGANLDPVVGSEQRGRRPVLVVSLEDANQLLPVVTVVPLTSRKQARRVYPNEAVLPAGTARLAAESLVLAHQIRTLSKQRLGAPIGRLEDGPLRDAVRSALRFHLDLR